VETDCGPILIVDDDAVFREFVGTLLGRIGHLTQEAANGEDALQKALAERPSLVLLDVDIPGVSGYEVCRELRDTYGPALPIVFVSGTRVDRLDLVGGLLVGADDYLVKPVDPDELLARVRRHVARSEAPVPASSDGVPNLTPREREILALLASGLDQRTIAKDLVISSKTVATHIQRILGKLGVGSRAQAVAFAHRHGLAGERQPDGALSATTASSSSAKTASAT
jgi:two-component system nitrate/nitrite response regulator NarL